ERAQRPAGRGDGADDAGQDVRRIGEGDANGDARIGHQAGACSVALARSATSAPTALAPPSFTAATIADPTMMPSTAAASSRTCSGRETPKPTATGSRPSTAPRMRSSRGRVVSATRSRAPVTPYSGTTYRK